MKKPVMAWQELSFLDNLDAGARVLGYNNLPLAWGLAKVQWRSIEERDGFLNELTRTEGGLL